MKGKFDKFGKSFFGILVLFMCSAATYAGWGGGGGGSTRVAEPAAVILLGTGLISLAVYAKKKNGKK